LIRRWLVQVLAKRPALRGNPFASEGVRPADRHRRFDRVYRPRDYSGTPSSV